MAAGEGPSRIAVVIPAYQAGARVGKVVTRVRAVLRDAPVYVVDDGSRDDTGAAATAAGARVLDHGENRGKGAALASGLEQALHDGARLIATLDADGQHPPDALPDLLSPLRSGAADLVLGARARTRPMPLGRRITNWISATCASRITTTRIPDAQTGFRAFSSELALALQPQLAQHLRFDYEAVFLLAALRGGYRVHSVTVPTVYDGAPSHFRSWRDSWRLARVFARYYLGAT
jgi:glycosyltransferase involved in cell wall biosynthesis